MSVFHDEVEIEDFEFDEETQTYYYPCPCGDQFQISKVLALDCSAMYWLYGLRVLSFIRKILRMERR